MTLIRLSQLENNPKNPNVCNKETLEKLQRNIGRTRIYPALIVRKHPKKANRYIIIDGHHRKLVLEALGDAQAECQVVDVNEKEAHILLATLNRLHGTDNLQKRAELIETLTELVPVDELLQMIPESKAEIDDLLDLLRHDLDGLEKALKAEIEQEAKTLPVALSFMVDVDQAETINAAISLFKAKDRGFSLVALSQFALEMKKA